MNEKPDDPFQAEREDTPEMMLKRVFVVAEIIHQSGKVKLSPAQLPQKGRKTQKPQADVF